MDVEVASHRKHKNFDIVKFKGLYHINDVEKYKGYSLKVAEENLTDLDDGEFYYHEIIGLDVYEGDTLIGQVKDTPTGGQRRLGSETQRQERLALALYSSSGSRC